VVAFQPKPFSTQQKSQMARAMARTLELNQLLMASIWLALILTKMA
jgi:hypothetical protein